LAPRQSRRSFLGVFNKPPRELKQPEFEPGYTTLLQYRVAENENARPPPRKVLVDGLKKFINYKHEQGTALNSTQAFLVNCVLRHLLKAPSEEDTPDEGNGSTRLLDFHTLSLIFGVAGRAPTSDDIQNHYELGKLLYDAVKEIADISRDTQTPRWLEVPKRQLLDKYMSILSWTGNGSEALQLFENHCQGQSIKDLNDWDLRFAKNLWQVVLKSLAAEGKEEELVRAVAMGFEMGFPYDSGTRQIMVQFFAFHDRIDETKYWFAKPLEELGGSHSKPYYERKMYTLLMKFAIRNNQQQWLDPIIEDVRANRRLNSSDEGMAIDLFLQWSVLSRNKGPEEIKAIIQTESSSDKGWKPSGKTINLLVKAATEINNPYFAERFFALGMELGIEPLPNTYFLQMDYRLDAGDIAGAEVAYQIVKNMEFKDANQDRTIPMLNKLIRKLCSKPQPDIKKILDITSELEQRQAVLEPETVVALCITLLEGDQQLDAMDTLSLHTVSYSLQQRAKVSDALVEFCLRPDVSTARVWDAYQVLRQFFPETDAAGRMRLMEAFFYVRRRPDMACTIFGHMRAHKNDEMRPTADMYALCFEGLANHPDPDSLRIVHNMLKMDTTIAMNTKLYTALMIAHVGAGLPRAALEFWGEITRSAEGPSYNSLAAVFWACEVLGAADKTARQVWKKVQAMDLDVPENVFTAYCGALAGSGHLVPLQNLIQTTEPTLEYGISDMT